MRNLIRSERGSALLITLGVLMLISTVGLMSVKRSSEDIEYSYNILHEEQAFYVAEAGFRQAVSVLDTLPTWRGGFNDVSFGPGSYTVSILDSTSFPGIADTIVVESRGEARECAAVVQVALVRVSSNPFRYAMFADDGISFDKNTCTDSWDSDSGSYAATQLDSMGNVGSNGTITSSKDVVFGGDISVATDGGISLGTNNTVNGDTSSTADSVDLDIVPQTEYDWAQANSDALTGISGTNYNYNTGTKALTSGSNGNIILQTGVYYFSSILLGQGTTLTLAPDANVVIYMGGDITFNQSSTVNDGGSPSSLQIYSQGSLQFDQDNAFYGAYYGPDGHVQYDQTTEVYGSLVANTIQLDRGACFHYDRALGSLRRYAPDGVIQVAWCEVDD